MSQLLKANEIVIGSGRKIIADGTFGPSKPSRSIDTPYGLNDTADRDAKSIDWLKDRISEFELTALQAASAHALELEALEQTAFQQGMDEGLKLGAAGVTREHEEQLNVFHAAVQEALDAFRQQLRTVEILALDLTQLTLERIFGDPALQSDLVAQTTRHHLAQLTANSAVGVRVSAADFPEAEQLNKAFGAPDEHPALSVRADPQLPSGACLIELLLGRLDVSLPRQSSHAVGRLAALRQGG